MDQAEKVLRLRGSGSSSEAARSSRASGVIIQVPRFRAPDFAAHAIQPFGE
jgi:hypothetical protein